jgi:mono/diheme cytochrome c family protein
MAALSGLLLSLVGCNHDQFPSYSLSLKYPLRQDPILMKLPAELGDERYDPDTPGQFPLMHFDDILKPGNPLEPKAKEIKDKEILRDPTKLSTKEKNELEAALEEIFGTPAIPMVNAQVAGLDAKTIEILKIDNDTLAKGSTRYRVHCLHCHGVAGDGRGPTARWINPHPRDFRSGLFKFQSVNQIDSKPGEKIEHKNGTRPPARADLIRTLRNGLEGTAMPSFALLEDKELEWIVSYVIHLSIRGQVERDLLKSSSFAYDAKKDTLSFHVDPEDEEAPPTIAAAVKAQTQYTAEKSYRALRAPAEDRSWLFSQKPELAIHPEPYPAEFADEGELAASRLRGKYLFTGDETKYKGAKNANCVSCHVDFGRQAKFRFDEWATLVRPNNFTAGTFRGGRRPVDMYYRIHSGINGSGMTNFGGALKGKEIWDIINFVSALPYPAMQKQVGIVAN